MKKKSFFRSNGVQSLLASLICILLGLLVGYIVLLFINPQGAGKAILTVVKNFFDYSRPATRLKYFGETLVKTAPLLMCSLSVLFAYKVGLFNIGAAGQYVVGGIQTNGQMAVLIALAMLLVISLVHLPKKEQ